MVKYRLILSIGYCNVSLLYDNIEDLDFIVRSILSHKEDGEDTVKLDIEVVLDDKENKEV